MEGIAKSATVAVVGAGAMGSGIAQVAAAAGHPVLLFDAVAGAADRGKERIDAALGQLERKGRLTAEQRERIASSIKTATELDELGEARLIIEAIVEKLEAKQTLFQQLEKVAADDTIFATNTSSISVTAIGAALSDPSRLAGFHFFNPAPLMKLIEIVAGLASRPQVLDILADTAREWGKIPVHVRSTPGFIVNRVARPYYGEALRLFEEKVTDAATLDLIYTQGGGFRMGPFALMDMIGHDVNFAVSCSVYAALFDDPRYRPSLTQQELVAAGWLGRKSGRGFFAYGEGADLVSHPLIFSAHAAPDSIVLEGKGPALCEIAELCQASGIALSSSSGAGYLKCGDTYLAQTDGRSATQRVADGAPSNLVLFDLFFDLAGAELSVLAQADQAAAGSIEQAAGLFQALGKSVVVVEDHPGMVLMRTMALLVDEAADVVQKGIASPEDVEVAMQTGVNYPRGLLDWGDRIGAATLVQVLDNIRHASADSRYRTTELLRRCALTSASLASCQSELKDREENG